MNEIVEKKLKVLLLFIVPIFLIASLVATSINLGTLNQVKFAPKNIEPEKVDLPNEPVKGRLTINFKPDMPEQERKTYLESIGAKIVGEIKELNSVTIELDENKIEEIKKTDKVAKAEPDYYVSMLEDQTPSPSSYPSTSTQFTVNDPRFAEQWGLEVIGAKDGWVSIKDNLNEIKIAVIDSGICSNHPDLQGKLLSGYDFVEDDNNPQDDLGHGCAVTGVIAANLNNNLGIAGVAPNARIIPLRVLDGNGLGTYSDVAEAIVYAVNNGVKIINLSLGGTNASSILENAVNYAKEKDVAVVAAAGNTGKEGVLYPAAYKYVIAVGSLDPTLQQSSFNSYGPEVDIYAPGRDILSTSKNGEYNYVSGTSFAVPFITSKEVNLLVNKKDIASNENNKLETSSTPKKEVKALYCNKNLDNLKESDFVTYTLSFKTTLKNKDLIDLLKQFDLQPLLFQYKGENYSNWYGANLNKSVSDHESLLNEQHILMLKSLLDAEEQSSIKNQGGEKRIEAFKKEIQNYKENDLYFKSVKILSNIKVLKEIVKNTSIFSDCIQLSSESLEVRKELNKDEVSAQGSDTPPPTNSNTWAPQQGSVYVNKVNDSNLYLLRNNFVWTDTSGFIAPHTSYEHEVVFYNWNIFDCQYSSSIASRVVQDLVGDTLWENMHKPLVECVMPSLSTNLEESYIDTRLFDREEQGEVYTVGTTKIPLRYEPYYAAFFLTPTNSDNNSDIAVEASLGHPAVDYNLSTPFTPEQELAFCLGAIWLDERAACTFKSITDNAVLIPRQNYTKSEKFEKSWPNITPTPQPPPSTNPCLDRSNGLYCGATLNLNFNTLYKCNNGVVSTVQACSNGCSIQEQGVDDFCKAGTSGTASTCPNGQNGLYCGSSVGLDSNTLYYCQNGTKSVYQSCSYGCVVKPPGTADVCKSTPTSTASCPSGGNGNYCGTTLGLDPNKLYNCNNGTITEQQSCANGCELKPSGTPDACYPAGSGGSTTLSGSVKLFGNSDYTNLRLEIKTAKSEEPSRGTWYKSMQMPSGWSVVLHDHPLNEVGNTQCFNQTQINLETQGGWANSIEAIELFTNNVCPAPNTESFVKICRDTGGTRCEIVTSDIRDLGGSGFGDNTLKSIYFAGNWEASLFEHGDYQGAKRTLSDSNNDLGGVTVLPFGYGTSSIKVRRKEPTGFILFDLGDRNGAQFKSDRPVDNLDHWRRTGEDSWNDDAKSIYLDPGFTAVLCEDAGFRGRCVRVNESMNFIPELGGNSVSSVQLCEGPCPAAPSAPSRVSPAEGQTFLPGTPVSLNWIHEGEDSIIEVWGGNLTQVQRDYISNNQRSWTKFNLAGSSNPYFWKVKGANKYGEGAWSQTFSFMVQDEAPTQAVIYGNEFAELNTDQSFTTFASPSSAANLTYNWSPQPKSGQGTSNVVYSWNSIGNQTISLTVQNTGGSVTSQFTIPVGCPEGKYLAEYYNNNSLSGSPITSRCENAINNNWGTGGPQYIGDYGNGKDGSLQVTSAQTIYTDDRRTSVSQNANQGAQTITVADKVFNVGDKVLIIQMRGNNASAYEINEIVGLNEWTMSLKNGLKYNYYTQGAHDRTQIIRIPEYTNITVDAGGVITAHPWDGNTGGIVYFMANGTVEINGMIKTDGLGFRGGNGGAGATEVSDSGDTGESYAGGPIIGAPSSLGGSPSPRTPENASAGQGGQGKRATDGSSGGGGGSYGTQGTAGGQSIGGANAPAAGGIAGITAGSQNLAINLLPGSGGGGGGKSKDPNGQGGGHGGNGAGAIGMQVKTLVIGATGSISAKGNNGNNGISDQGAGGGAGSGGGIFIKSENTTISNPNGLNIKGGTGGNPAGANAGGGGNGGDGRLMFNYCNPINGTINASYYSIPYNCGLDNFSVRWSGNIPFDTTGNYKFNITSDDGYKLFIDNTLISDKWVNGEQNENITRTITQGNHNVKLEYYEANGNAYANLAIIPDTNDAPTISAIPDQSILQGGTFTTFDLDNYVIDPNGDAITWSYSGQNSLTVNKDAENVVSVTYVSGWGGEETIRFTATDTFGENSFKDVKFAVSKCALNKFQADYFNNKDLSGNPIYSECLNNIDTNWGTSAPQSIVNIGATDNFSIRYSGKINFALNRNYKFTTYADDGVKLFIDNNLKIDKWVDAYSQSEVIQNMTAGIHDIKLEYYENTGNAQVKLVYPYVNTAPVIGSIQNQTRGAGETYASFDLDNYVSDAENDPVTWSFGATRNLTLTKDSNNILSITYTRPWSGTETIAFKATDSLGLFTTKNVSFTMGKCITGKYNAEYYNNTQFNGTAVYSECVTSINNNWQNSGPASVADTNAGNGKDGDFMVWLGQTNYTDNIRSSVTTTSASGQNTIIITSPTSYVVGDEVLIMQMQGTNAGVYEFRKVTQININSLTLDANLSNTYTAGGNSKAQVIKVPQYNNLIVNGTLTAHPWDGSTGGVVVFRATGTVDIMGTIDATRKGFRGGNGHNTNQTGQTGEGTSGPSVYQTNANGNAGGSALQALEGGPGGGGGGNYKAGEIGAAGGTAATRGAGGVAYDYVTNNFSKLFMGGGGGAGGRAYSNPGGRGGEGGGIIIVNAKKVTITGTIIANGGAGTFGTYAAPAPENRYGYSGGGGGGAGGSIYIKAEDISLGTTRVTTTGGAYGNSGGGASGRGGVRGYGAVKIEYCNTVSGTTVTSYTVVQQRTCTKDNFSVKYTGVFNFNDGTYTFTTAADDGLKLMIDSDIVQDRLSNALSSLSTPKTLTAGKKLVTVNYVENAGTASNSVTWTEP